MNILMFAPQFAPAIGGAERQAEKLAKALLPLGINVKVVTPLLVAESPLNEDRDGLAVRRFKLHDLSKHLRWRGIGLLNIPWITLQIVVKLWTDVGRADLVHCHIGCLQSLAAAFTAHLRGKPVICKAAMAGHKSDLGEMASNGVLNAMLAKISRNAFTKWIATTHAVRDGLISSGIDETRITIIPNGVEIFSPPKYSNNFTIRKFLYLGRLSSNIQRDIPRLIKAFDNLCSFRSDLQLAIVGDGDLFEETKHLISQCSHAPQIILPGADIAHSWFDWADAFVLPSRREGLSNALLEAMSHGLPCVATDIPPNREVLVDGAFGILVPVNDTLALEEALIHLIDNNILAKGIAKSAFDHVKNTYDINIVSKRYYELYEKLLS